MKVDPFFVSPIFPRQIQKHNPAIPLSCSKSNPILLQVTMSWMLFKNNISRIQDQRTSA